MTQLQLDTIKLEQPYTFKDKTKVLAFLTPALVSLLEQAPDQIRPYFPDAKLYLDVVTDPEATNWTQLILSIATKLEGEAAFAQLDKVEDEWWFDASRKANVEMIMGIHLEYPDEF